MLIRQNWMWIEIERLHEFSVHKLLHIFLLCVFILRLTIPVGPVTDMVTPICSFRSFVSVSTSDINELLIACQTVGVSHTISRILIVLITICLIANVSLKQSIIYGTIMENVKAIFNIILLMILFSTCKFLMKNNFIGAVDWRIDFDGTLCRYCHGMLCLFKSNRKFRKVLEYNQNVRTRRRCVSDGNSLGKSSVLHFGSIETILCFQAMLNQILVFKNSSKIYALLHSHLVRGLDMFRVLSRRPMQLLRYCEFHIILTVILKLLKSKFFSSFHHRAEQSVPHTFTGQ